jgi:DNA repair protein RecO (recombination protein O)
MTEHQVRGIILRTIRYRDADLIVHLLSENGQRLNFLARSALKSKKRFGGGVLEPLHCIRATYSESRAAASETAPLHHLREAELQIDFKLLRSDYSRLQQGLYFLRLVSTVVKDGDLEQAGLFNILGRALRNLETDPDLAFSRLAFEAKVLSQQGVLPPESDFRVLFDRSGSGARVGGAAGVVSADGPFSGGFLDDEQKRRLRSRLDGILSGYLDQASVAF